MSFRYPLDGCQLIVEPEGQGEFKTLTISILGREEGLILGPVSFEWEDPAVQSDQPIKDLVPGLAEIV